MKTLCLALLFTAVACAQTQSLTFYIDNSNGAAPTTQLQELPSTYAFADTPVGGSSTLLLRLVNTSGASVQVTGLGFVTGPDSSQTQSFTSNLPVDFTLAPQAWKTFTVSFSPTTATALSATMQVGINLTTTFTVATLQGNGTPPQLALTCTSLSVPTTVPQCNGSALQPNTVTPISYGNVLVTDTAAIQFTLSNNGPAALNPQTLIRLVSPANNPNTAFTPPTLPTTLASGSSVNFTITFAPGSATTFQITLNIGTESFLLQGAGTSNVVGDISSLTVSYFDPSCKCSAPANPATPIPFGQVIAGGTTSFTINVTNPSTTIDAVTVPTLQVSGAGFALTGAPTLPSVIQPGASISFQITFSASALGSATGSLSIGSRQFPLQAQSIAPLVSNAAFSVDVQPLTSQQQAHLSITVSPAPTAPLIGTLTMQFASSVTNVTADPAITFVGSSSPNLQVTVPAGSQNATYNGQPAITFQTGTTAGTITFTLTFANAPPFTQTFIISPSKVQITSVTAVRQSPNLVITMTGYDNTYSIGSAGPLSFSFATTAGTLTATADASSAFHQYFFTNDTAGGAFSLQASFAVTGGDVTQITSVIANLTNSVGQTSLTQAFQ